MPEPERPQGVGLRPFDLRHTDFAYRLACHLGPQWVRLCANGVPDPAQFPSRLAADVLLLMVIHGEENTKVEPDGLAAIYSPSFLHGTAHAEVVGVHGGLSSDAETQALRTLIATAERNWPLRRLYLSHLSCGPNPAAVAGLEYWEVARLPEAVLVDGHYWDLATVAIVLDGNGAKAGWSLR